MDNAYLSTHEIYAIDNLTEDNLLDFTTSFPSTKKELVLHIFSKNRSIQVLEVLANEHSKNNKRLIKLLEANGIPTYT